MTPFQLSTVIAILFVALLALTGRIPYVVEFRSLWRRAAAALLFTEILAIVCFLPAVAPNPDDFDPRLVWFPLVFLTHVPMMLFLFLWWALRGDISLPRFISISASDLGRKVSQGLWYGAACWVFAVVATVTIGSFAESAGAYSAPQDPPTVVMWMAELSLGQKLAIVIVAMTVEEAFFRAFLQARIGLIPASVLFALAHFSYDLPLLVIGVFVVSLVIGHCYERTRDLLPCMIAHAVFNGVQLLIVLPAVKNSWLTPPV